MTSQTRRLGGSSFSKLGGSNDMADVRLKGCPPTPWLRPVGLRAWAEVSDHKGMDICHTGSRERVVVVETLTKA